MSGFEFNSSSPTRNHVMNLQPRHGIVIKPAYYRCGHVTKIVHINYVCSRPMVTKPQVKVKVKLGTLVP